MPDTLKVNIENKDQWDKEIKAAQKKQFSFEHGCPKFAGYTMIIYHVQDRIMTPLIHGQKSGYVLFPNAVIIDSIAKTRIPARKANYKPKIRLIKEFDNMHQLLAFFEKLGKKANNNKIYSAAKHKGTYMGYSFDWMNKKTDYVKGFLMSRQLELDFENTEINKIY